MYNFVTVGGSVRLPMRIDRYVICTLGVFISRDESRSGHIGKYVKTAWGEPIHVH